MKPRFVFLSTNSFHRPGSCVALRAAKYFLFFAVLQNISSGLFVPQFAQAQSAAKTKAQKLVNPLNDLLDEARRDIDAGNFDAAIVPLNKVIEQEPASAYAHFQLAYVYTALKRPAEARPEYERTIALDPKMSEAYVNLGILLIDADPAAAVAPLRQAVELLPSQSRPRFLLGAAQERSGDPGGAAKTLEGAAHLDSRDVETLNHLAHLYLKLNRPADAEAKYRAVLEIQPGDAQALLGVAQCLDAQKKPSGEAYNAYFSANPSDTTVRSRLVHALMDQQQYDQALAELDRSDAGKTPSLDSLKLRADILIAQKKWDASVTTLQQAIALSPSDAQLHGGLGRIYMQKHDYVSAEKELKAALQIDHSNLAYGKDLSSSYYLAGDYPRTLAMLDLIAKAEQPTAGTWFIRALCYDKLKQPKPALEAYQKFLELDQNKNPDQVWQANERSKVLKKMLEHTR
jgi:Flp pilus assembly protein TadD